MAHLFNRNVLLGVCGGIAAYKSAQLVRELQSLGASVRVIMTRGAQAFITPLTLQALSGNPVHTELLDAEAERGMGHIELARWADLLLVAPATADLIARLAAGRADDLLSTVALATPAPRLLAPAMNQQMWRDPATGANLKTLHARGYASVGPEAGEQACGDIGMGRMSEPAVIAQHAAALFESGALAGRRVVITAGPTREPLDPVRFISNHSSGRMGFALAQAAVDAGALTTVIAGPVQLATPRDVGRIDVETAQQMLEASLACMDACDIFIACAAVADYRPAQVANQKIKKQGERLELALLRNPDIVGTITERPQPPFTVGFAAETESLESHALAKLEQKRLDLIIANRVGEAGSGFNSEQNAVSVYWRGGAQHYERAGKSTLARALVELIAGRFHAHTQAVAPSLVN
jgi:phosphopantothenoylcysteine decarboxylase/phosphopantothenate--cysteine ligase